MMKKIWKKKDLEKIQKIHENCKKENIAKIAKMITTILHIIKKVVNNHIITTK